MKILFISPSIPSPLHRVRALNLLKVLSTRHAVRLVTLAPTHDPVRSTEHLSFLADRPRIVVQPFARSLLSCLTAPVRGVPLEIAYCASPAMHRAVAEELAAFRPDLVYIKRLRSLAFLPETLPCPALLDVTDAMALSYARALRWSPPHLRTVFWHEARSYIHAERAAAARFRTWVVASPVDAAALRRTLPPTVRVQVVPNVVDTDVFTPTSEPPGTQRLLLSGLMDKVVNVSAARFFVREILPAIHERVPNVTLTIAGPRPTPAVSALANPPLVTVTGYVPDLRPYIAEAAAVVVPVRAGTGTRNKILQAWAMGRAIVSTPEGAEGLAARDGENLLLAETPQAFGHAVVGLLQNPTFRSTLGRGGRSTVERVYDLRALDRALAPVLASAAESHAIMGRTWNAARIRP